MENDIDILEEAYSKSLNQKYVYMMYSFMNICTESDPGALLSMSVIAAGKERNIEEVANVAVPDKQHYYIIPFRESFIPAIIKGVVEEHPEFTPKPKLVDHDTIIDLEEAEEDDPRQRIVVCTVPEVNKDRHDLLLELTDTFYQKCKTEMTELQIKFMKQLMKYQNLLSEEEMNEEKNNLEKIYNQYVDMRDKLNDDKVKSIEEAYQRYLEHQSEESKDSIGAKTSQNKNIATSMNMFAEDDE
jgi:ribosome recycling factor